MLWTIERLTAGHDRAAFDCGNAVLNDWLKRYAGQYERRGLSRTYAGTRHSEPMVLGFYAIAMHRVCFEALPAGQSKGLPEMDVPVALIGQLAVDKRVQGQGLGRHLLLDAFRRIELLSQHIGVRAIEVHAVDDTARSFYLRYGFISLLDDPSHLYLPLQVVRTLKLPPLTT